MHELNHEQVVIKSDGSVLLFPQQREAIVEIRNLQNSPANTVGAYFEIVSYPLGGKGKLEGYALKEIGRKIGETPRPQKPQEKARPNPDQYGYWDDMTKKMWSDFMARQQAKYAYEQAYKAQTEAEYREQQNQRTNQYRYTTSGRPAASKRKQILLRMDQLRARGLKSTAIIATVASEFRITDANASYYYYRVFMKGQ